MKKIRCGICGKEFYQVDMDICTPCIKEEYGTLPVPPAALLGKGPCKYPNCPEPTYYEDGYCYFHNKVINGEMKVYLTVSEQENSNWMWDRDTTPDWVGTRRQDTYRANGKSYTREILTD